MWSEGVLHSESRTDTRCDTMTESQNIGFRSRLITVTVSETPGPGTGAKNRVMEMISPVERRLTDSPRTDQDRSNRARDKLIDVARYSQRVS